MAFPRLLQRLFDNDGGGSLLREEIVPYLTALEAYRKSLIGVPRYWRSTTLPANHCWANGDFIEFADWPELKEVYDDGGFAGMLLAYNADSSTIAANLGKWRPDAANPTGLYTPNLSGQFLRSYCGSGSAGTWGTDTGRAMSGSVDFIDYANIRGCTGVFSSAQMDGFDLKGFTVSEAKFASYFDFQTSRAWGEHNGSEFTPQHVWNPVAIYLGANA